MAEPQEPVLIEVVENEALGHRITYRRTQWNTLNVQIESIASYNGEDELVLTGGIRFDGCSNWQWAELAVHWCGHKDMQRLTDTVKQSYQYAEAFYGERWCGDHLLDDQQANALIRRS
jgi:hypothetical protein